MTLEEQREHLEQCLSRRLLPAPTRPAPEPIYKQAEVYPEGTCVDCGSEDYLVAEDNYHDLLCSDCRMCRRPGGY